MSKDQTSTPGRERSAVVRLLCGGTLTAEMFETAMAMMPPQPPPILMPGGQLTRREAAELMRMGPPHNATSAGSAESE